MFGVCAAVDVLLVRRSLPAHCPVFGAASTLGSGHVSFKLKGKGYTGMEAVMKALPHAKHLLMYRDVRKVRSKRVLCFFRVRRVENAMHSSVVSFACSCMLS